MPLTRIAGVIILLLLTGCAGMDRAPQGAAPKVEAKTERAPVPELKQAAAKAEKTEAAKPVPDSPVQEKPAPVELARAAPHVATSAGRGTPIKPEAPAAKALASAAPMKEESAVPPLPKPTPPPLNLKLLEKRLKETNAIGVIAKLTLKNQIDALLEQFRAYYEGRMTTTPAQLRQPYEQLFVKVLALLQDSDPPLANEITQSREAIWEILSDPNKFHNL